jgi:hypothetical protein
MSSPWGKHIPSFNGALALPWLQRAGQIRRMTTRRHFLATMGAGLGILSTRDHLLSSLFAPADKLSHVGIQLYTVRSLMAKDFEGTLAQIAGIGYGEVEFAGYFNRTGACGIGGEQADGAVHAYRFPEGRHRVEGDPRPGEGDRPRVGDDSVARQRDAENPR